MKRRITPLICATILLAVVCVLLISTRTSTMFKVCLFSPVKGKVVLNGQPVAGAVIERTYDWAWKNQKGGDTTVTDQNGEFSLPAIHGTMVLGNVLPHEPVIEQTVNIQHQGKTHEAWYTHKREYTVNCELEGKSIDLLCPLETEPNRHEGGLFGYYGIGQLR